MEVHWGGKKGMSPTLMFLKHFSCSSALRTLVVLILHLLTVPLVIATVWLSEHLDLPESSFRRWGSIGKRREPVYWIFCTAHCHGYLKLLRSLVEKKLLRRRVLAQKKSVLFFFFLEDILPGFPIHDFCFSSGLQVSSKRFICPSYLLEKWYRIWSFYESGNHCYQQHRK